MFDIGFLEIFVILVVAILALGPDKLPEFISSVAKTIKGVKRAIGDAKASVENEINLEDMKKEVDSYKNSIDFTKETIEKNNPANIAQKEISNIQEQLSNTYQDDQVIPDDLKNKEKDEEDLVKNKKEKKKKDKKEKKKKKKEKKEKDV